MFFLREIEKNLSLKNSSSAYFIKKNIYIKETHNKIYTRLALFFIFTITKVDHLLLLLVEEESIIFIISKLAN